MREGTGGRDTSGHRITADDLEALTMGTRLARDAVSIPNCGPGAAVAREGHLTIEVPDTLAAHIEHCCARRGARVGDVLRQILEREFPPPEVTSE